TFDGLSIAWATIEHLHETNRCRALFATHFHELTALAAKLPRLFNATVRVKEWQGEVVFLHEVIAGAADRSYGIQVAKLAGLPAAVIERAKLVLAELEAIDRTAPTRRLADDLPLFSAARAVSPAVRTDPAAAALLAAKPTGASLATPSVPRKSRSPSADTAADFRGMSSAVETAFKVTPAHATSASSSMSPEHNSNPVPPVAGCRPAMASARPVSTLQ